MSNGLGSPSCRPDLGAELAPDSRSHCETSGFVAAAAPTSNYGIDVHIDTGVLGLSSGGLLSAVQDLVVSPLWMALVWVAHALIVMLEWGFSIDLLDGASASGLGAALARAQSDLTAPWLPLALSLAAMLAAYQGLVRRRVAETLAELALMAAMLVGGMWLILDPAGTVGALARWSNQAGLAILAVATQGSPSGPGRTLGTSLNGVFRATIEGPWCYLEFGDVDWCREPSRMDRSLHAAGLKIAARETQRADCEGPPSCGAGRSAGNETMLHSGRLLREARTNGAVFLSLPANGPDRNSINDQGSLLQVICRSQDASSCSGPDAAQAEFRTNSGTWSRLGGLLLIAAGLMGMALLLGYIAARLLMASVLSLFYLLLAPGVVLAPAFGEPGRHLFRSWLTRLLAAVLSKLIFAFLLGVVLTVMAAMSALTALGWWTQWLLMSVFWWGTFSRRHQLLSSGGEGAQRARPRQGSVARRLGGALELQRRVLGTTRGRAKPPPAASERWPPAARDRPPAAEPDRQALRLLRPSASQTVLGEGWALEQTVVAEQARLERINVARAEAMTNGDGRRAIRLADRAKRLGVAIARRQEETVEYRKPSAGRMRERSAFLDLQAQLPRAGRRDSSGGRRDYAALAALAGHSRVTFEELDPKRRRAVRLEIDRELTQRGQRLLGAGLVGGPTPTTVDVRTPAASPPSGSSDALAPQRRARARQPSSPSEESDLMRDLRALSEGRKGQIGFDHE